MTPKLITLVTNPPKRKAKSRKRPAKRRPAAKRKPKARKRPAKRRAAPKRKPSTKRKPMATKKRKTTKAKKRRTRRNPVPRGIRGTVKEILSKQTLSIVGGGIGSTLGSGWVMRQNFIGSIPGSDTRLGRSLIRLGLHGVGFFLLNKFRMRELAKGALYAGGLMAGKELVASQSSRAAALLTGSPAPAEGLAYYGEPQIQLAGYGESETVQLAGEDDGVFAGLGAAFGEGDDLFAN